MDSETRPCPLAEQVNLSPNGLLSSSQTAGMMIRSKFPRVPAAHEPMTRPCKSSGVLVILTSAHPNPDPIMNVRRMFTGMNHLYIISKSIN
ncbi:hypothetical protein HanPSC8_Chr14g0619961 [Helianthus annuus]|nr:hypothetical protein HanPSC8_Chr14g0619961 [Helianthus annuus]